MIAKYHYISPFSSFLPKTNQNAILGPKSLEGFIDAPVLPPNAIMIAATNNPTSTPVVPLGN